MPRKANLSEIVPNRFYEIDVTVKYQHVADNVITAVIEQGDVQTKISIPKEGVELQEGKQYNFEKCFKSKNGWLYAKNPQTTVTEKGSQRLYQSWYSLRQLFQEKEKLANHYIDTVLKVVSVEPKQQVNKNDENLNLYNLKCFEGDLLVNVELWNQEIKVEQVKNKVFKFVGFKVKPTSHQTITLVSTVYSKIQKLSRLPFNREKYVYNPNTVYKNVSSFYDIRTIEELEIQCEQRHKNYSIITAQINQSEQLQYEGCSKCKKKIEDNKCYQCGSKIKKQNYKYLKIVLQDDTSMLECAVFDDESLDKIKQLGQNEKAYFYVKSSAKKNQQTGEFFTSNVVTQVKLMRNSQ